MSYLFHFKKNSLLFHELEELQMQNNLLKTQLHEIKEGAVEALVQKELTLINTTHKIQELEVLY